MRLALLLPFICLPLHAASQDQNLSLQQALALARSNRPSVAAARQRVLSATFSRRALGAFPATRVFAGYQSSLALDGTEDDLAIAQPLDVFGRTSAARASGSAAVLKAEAELRQTLADLQFDVIRQYGEAAAARALAESAGRSEEIAQKLHDAIKILVEEGRLPGVQLQRVAIELERSKLTTAQRNAELKASYQRLGGLLNMPADRLQVAGFAELSVETAARESLQAQRPELLLLSSEVKASDAAARIAGLGLHPELEIVGRRTPWQQSDSLYGLRIQLSVPLFDHGKTRAEVRAAKTSADAARKALQDATRIAESELEAAKTELDAAADQIRRFELIDKATLELVEKSRIGFSEKAITLIELLEATRALREVEEGLAEARLRLAKAQADTLRASGRFLEERP